MQADAHADRPQADGQNGKRATYLLRDIPGELWLRAKHSAVDKRISLRDLLLNALRDCLK